MKEIRNSAAFYNSVSTTVLESSVLGKDLRGTEYAQRFIDQIKESDIEVLLETMVIEMTPEKEIYACSGKHGMVYLTCGAIVAAMGCRERTASQVLLYGKRPAGCTRREASSDSSIWKAIFREKKP